MKDYKFGDFVMTLSGRDKGKIFVIAEDAGEYVYLVDGIYRTLAKPKKKNKKHVISLAYSDTNLLGKWESQSKIVDEEIKRSIKIYKKSINEKEL